MPEALPSHNKKHWKDVGSKTSALAKSGDADAIARMEKKYYNQYFSRTKDIPKKTFDQWKEKREESARKKACLLAFQNSNSAPAAAPAAAPAHAASSHSAGLHSPQSMSVLSPVRQGPHQIPHAALPHQPLNHGLAVPTQQTAIFSPGEGGPFGALGPFGNPASALPAAATATSMAMAPVLHTPALQASAQSAQAAPFPFGPSSVDRSGRGGGGGGVGGGQHHGQQQQQQQQPSFNSYHLQQQQQAAVAAAAAAAQQSSVLQNPFSNFAMPHVGKKKRETEAAEPHDEERQAKKAKKD
jgi:hypothetical protein